MENNSTMIPAQDNIITSEQSVAPASTPDSATITSSDAPVATAPAPKTDGFKFVFKEPGRLAIFIISIVLAIACFICAGVFANRPYVQDYSNSSTSSHSVTGTLFIGSKNININNNYTYYSFTPSTSGSYTFTTSSTYSYSTYDTYGTLYGSNWREISSNDDSGNGQNFSITSYLTGGSTYYIGVKLYNSSSNSSYATVNLTVSKNY